MIVEAFNKYFFKDICSISRYIESINSDGSMGVTRKEVVYSKIPCKLSFNSNLDKVDVLSYKNQINTDIKLFCNNDIDIKSGDYISIDRLEKIYCGYAGDIAKFETHIEVTITNEEVS